MSRGAGLSLSPSEKDPVKIVGAVRQLMEGRSNAVGTVTLTNDGVATTTTVSAQTCGPNSVVLLFPATAAASTFLQGSSLYVATTNITARQFIVTHAATATANLTFMWVCLG